MTPSPNPAIFIHDTKRIIDANPAACALFRCERWELIDRDLLDLVPEAFKDLTRINLYVTRRGKGSNVQPKNYDFIRCDGSIFAAEVKSTPLPDGHFETVVMYRYDVR